MLIISNHGLIEANDVVVMERYDVNVSFIDSTPPPDAGNNEWHLGVLNPGESKQIVINVQVSPDLENNSVIWNYANVTCREGLYGEAKVKTIIKTYPPSTHKEFDGIVINKTLYGGYLLHFIPKDTMIRLVAVDNGSGVNKTMYRIFKWVGKWLLLFDWSEYKEPINLFEIGVEYNLSGCGKYQIEFYSIDKVGNAEKVKWNDVFVDCFAPTSSITAPAQAKEAIDIIVNASDMGVGVSHVDLYYRYSEDNSTWGAWQFYGSKENNFEWHFEGKKGYYQFYSVAYDEVGNHEALPNNTTIPKAHSRITKPWDINGDGRVNVVDLYVVIIHWNETPESPTWDENADVNGDGIINSADIVEIINHWTG